MQEESERFNDNPIIKKPPKKKVTKKKTTKKKSLFIRDFKEALEYINVHRTLKIAFFGNFIYFAITSFFFLYLELKQINDYSFFGSDFRVFYTSVQIFSTIPEELYISEQYLYPFRYFPLFPLVNYYFKFFPFQILFILNNLLMIFIHLISFILIIIMCRNFYNFDLENKTRQSLLIIGLVAPLQFPNLVMGQISELYILLMLLSILILENIQKKRYHLKHTYYISGLLIGIASIFKPFAILIVPLFFSVKIIKNNHKIRIILNFNKIISQLMGFFSVFAINFYFWIRYPNYIQDFILKNDSAQILNYSSTSLTRLIYQLYNIFGIKPAFSQSILMLFLTIILYGIVILIKMIIDEKYENPSLFYSLVHLIFLISFPDSWFLYFLIFYFLGLPGILNLEEKLRTDLKTAEKFNPKLKNKQFNRKILLINKYFFITSNVGLVYFGFLILISIFFAGIDFIYPIILIFLYTGLVYELFIIIKISSRKIHN